MLIKAGTYRFNDVLTAPHNDEVRANINFTVTVTVGSDTFTETFYSITVYFDGNSLEFLYWDKDHLQATQPYSNGWSEYEGSQFITIPNVTEVSADFYEWFTENAVHRKEISGVWKFNDVLRDYAHINENVNYTCNAYSRLFGVEVQANCSRIASGAFTGGDYGEAGFGCYVESTVPDLSAYGFVCPRYVRVYQEDGWNTGAFEIKDKCIYFGTTPQYVSADFYNWMTENAVPVMATITHNGSTLAELFPGQTATLKCKGMKMEDDVVVAVGELPESNGSGDGSGVTVVPLTVTENGVYDARIDTEVWDSNTEYAWTATYNGLTLSIKKADKLTVPDVLADLWDKKYTVGIEIDGEAQQELLAVRLNTANDVFATWNDYSVLWCKNAAPLNALFGVNFLEDNTVYITNYLQMIQSAYHGAEYVKVSLTSFSEKANKGYCPITVNVTSAVVGVWKFNDDISGKPFTEKVNFTADYVVGDSIELYDGIALEEDAASNYLYFLNANGVMLSVYSAVNGWRNGIGEQISALTIDFGSEPQVVSATFKEWLQQNARPIYTIVQTE